MHKGITGIGAIVFTIVLTGMVIITGCGSYNHATPGNDTISGSVSGLGSAGVTVALSGGSTATAETDANGNYTFSGLKVGNYNVTPSKSGYTFSPVNSTATMGGCSSMMNNGMGSQMMGGQQGNDSGCSNMMVVNFTATAATGTAYDLSGMITTPDNGNMNRGLAGVTITLSGAGYGTTTTSAMGMYTFKGLANGEYTVQPGKSGYAFSPVSSVQTINNADIMNANFIGTPSTATTYFISGTISASGRGMLRGLAGVPVTLGGAVTGSTITDVNGNYSFSGLSNGDYTITPALSGFVFTPVSSVQTVSDINIPGVDFTTTTN